MSLAEGEVAPEFETKTIGELMSDKTSRNKPH